MTLAMFLGGPWHNCTMRVPRPLNPVVIVPVFSFDYSLQHPDEEPPVCAYSSVEYYLWGEIWNFPVYRATGTDVQENLDATFVDEWFESVLDYIPISVLNDPTPPLDPPVSTLTYEALQEAWEQFQNHVYNPVVVSEQQMRAWNSLPSQPRPIANPRAHRAEHDSDCSNDQMGVRFSKMDEEAEAEMSEWEQILKGKK